MLRVTLVGLIAGGHSGVPRYAAALTSALDRVAPEHPELALTLLTTPAGRDRVGLSHIEVELAGARGRLASATGGPQRILAEQLAARGQRADLLHFFDLTGPLLAPRRAFTTTLHDLAVFRGFQGSRVIHKRLFARLALARARAVVAVSGFARDEAVGRLGADPERIHVVHSGPGFGVVGSTGGAGGAAGDGAAADGAARHGAARDGAGTPYLLYVGNFLAHKNLPFLIRAYAASGVTDRLLLVGSWGDSVEQVRAAIGASPARERIELRSGVSDADLDELYRGARALLLPSRYEGFGFTALEAMARDCPVLASDIPAVREVCGAGARLVPLGREDAWAHAIRELAADPAERDALRRRGAEVLAGYSWERTARGVCAVLVAAGATG